MTVVVIDSGLANIASVVFALARLNVTAKVTVSADAIRHASHVILPGVGTASHAMQNLRDLGLVDVIPQLTQPVLGICLGMQLMFEHSEEGDVDCLAIFQGNIQKFKLPDLPVPHMGWNTITGKNNGYVYFVHSYYAPVSADTTAITHYGHDFSAMVQKNNFYGMQFHPERSGVLGEQLLKDFIHK